MGGGASVQKTEITAPSEFSNYRDDYHKVSAALAAPPP